MEITRTTRIVIETTQIAGGDKSAKKLMSADEMTKKLKKLFSDFDQTAIDIKTKDFINDEQ